MYYKNVKVIVKYVTDCFCNKKEFPGGKLYASEPRIPRKKMLREYAELYGIHDLTFSKADPTAIGLFFEPCLHRSVQVVRLLVDLC